MTYAPQTLLNARAYILDQTGLPSGAVGIVGDTSHTYGYHLGKDRLPSGDYSTRTSRDQSGLTNAASALDIGNFGNLWQLTEFLVAEARNGRLPDVREVIGPLRDGRAYRWDHLDGWTAVRRSAGDSHEWHIHCSYYRDSEHRDKTGPFRRYFEGVSEVPVPSGDPLLRLGSEGSDVRQLQAALNEAIDAGLAVDGDFGPATETAVKAYQRHAGLDDDGIYGPATAAALTGELSMPSIADLWLTDGIVPAPSKSPTKDTNAHWAPASIIRSTNDFVRTTNAELREATAAQRKRDEAILAAVQGLDTAAILARIDQRAAEEVARLEQAEAQRAEILALVGQVASGESDAAAVVAEIARRLAE